MSIYNGNMGIITDGLVLHLDAANPKSYPTTGTTWYDLSGNKNHGALINGPTFNTGNAGSIVFDGSNDYVNCGIGTETDFNGKKNMSISSWIYPISASYSDANIISKAYQWYINFNTDRKIRVCFYTGSGSYILFYSNSILNLNQWYNIIWTYNGSYINLFINGISDVTPVSQTSPVAYGLNKNCNVLLGAEANFCGSPETRYFNGKISHASIYNRALTATEVLKNYNALKGRYNL